jgi:molybdopterin synthase catalytic subunit
VDNARFRIVRGAIDPRSLEGGQRADEGARVTFLGVVRDRARDGSIVTGLSYEAYESMACAEFARIEVEAREHFGDIRLSIAHAVGELAVGEVAVAVSAAAGHRDAAFDACRFAIDELKRRAPIWKKEHGYGGRAEWVSNESHE